MEVVFTGFEPFGELEYNPSWDAAQAAAAVLSTSAELLPVTLDVARDIGSLAAPDRLLVHLGVARRGAEPRFERYAHNWWQDLDDIRPVRLDETGPSARECALPLDDWAETLGWKVSHDAGNYVCNATLYFALAATQNAMFVHIPPVEAEESEHFGVILAEIFR